MNIKITHSGDFSNTLKFLNKIKQGIDEKKLIPYAEKGVAALASATPVDTGKTASSWEYKIKKTKNTISLEFNNTHFVKKVPIAIILFYGHGTRNGGYVQGRDYINPAIQPVFDEIAEDIWKEVTE